MAASRTKCLCSDFSRQRYVPTYAFLRLDVYHYSAPPILPLSLPSSASIHPLYPLHPRRCLSTGLRLNKHITKLKYLQVPLISTQPLFQSVSQWDSVSRPSRGRTCIDAHLNKAEGGGFVYVCYITIFSCKAPRLTRPSVKLDLASVLINAKSKVTGIPDACTLPGNLLTLKRISMHIADSLSCTKKLLALSLMTLSKTLPRS